MGIIAPRTVPERANHELINTIYDLDGNVLLEGTNLYWNWAFADIDLDNNPEGMVIGMPTTPEAMVLFISKIDEGPATLAAQETFDIDEEALTGVHPWIPGHAPAPRTSVSNSIPVPDDNFSILRIPASKLGFEVGNYYVGYSWFDKKKRTTPISPFIQISIDSQGQQMRWVMPTSIPDGAVRMGLWVSEKNQGPSTARLQETVRVGRIIEPYHILTGPYHTRETGAADNKTKPARPKRPKLKKRRGHSVGKAGVYEVETVFVDDEGFESEPSEASEEVTVTQTEADDYVNLYVEWGDTTGADDARYRVYVTRISSPRERFLLEDRASQGGSGTPHSARVRPSFSGRTEEEADDGERNVLSRRARNSRRSSSSTARSETSDRSSSGGSVTSQQEGIEEPTDPPDVKVFGAAKLETNPTGTTTYWATLAYTARGEVGRAATAKPITLQPGETLRIIPADPTNLIRNSQFVDIDADGRPDGWTLTAVGGPAAAGGPEGTFSVSGGTMTLSTLGEKTISPAQTPLQKTPAVSNTFVVNRDESYVIGGTLTADIIKGSVQVYLEELDAEVNGSVVGTAKNLRDLISQTGSIDFSKRYGPTTDTAAGIEGWNDATVAARVVVRFAGNVRDAAVTIGELFVTPHDRRLRRYEEPVEYREPANSDPPNWVRWNKFFNKAVGPPPVGRRTPPRAAPLDKIDFGTTGPLGPAPTPWALRQLGSLGLTSQVTQAAAIDKPVGSYGWHVAKSSSNTGLYYIHRSFTPATRDKMAVRAKFRVRTRPTRGQIALLQIKHFQSDAANFALGYVTLTENGELWLYHWDPDGNNKRGIARGLRVATGIINGDILDIELYVSGAGTKQGLVQIALGKNGARRTLLSTLLRPDYTNPRTDTEYYAKVVQVGPSMYTDPATLWEFDIDSVTVTEIGDVLTDIGTVAQAEPIAQPDRPYRDATAIESLSFPTTSLPSSPWTNTRSPADSTTSLVAQSASAIGGTNGLRSTFVSSGVAKSAYITRTFTPDLSSLGARARIRIQGRPTTGGSVKVMAIRDASGREIASAKLESITSSSAQLTVTGTSYDQAISPSPLLVFTGLVDGNVITLELVAQGAGTANGLLSIWGQVGGGGTRAERKLYGQPQPLNWASSPIRTLRLGLHDASANAVSASVDYDDVVLTNEGELLFRETTTAGEPINQVWAYYQRNQEPQDDLWMRDFGVAVKPGHTYATSMWARYAQVEEQCFPCSFTAFGPSGTPYAIGCLFGPDGVQGTSEWALRTQTLVIPKAGDPWPEALGGLPGETYPEDCYEVWMDSPGVNAGEFVAQEFAFSPGTTPITEITYPTSGTMWVTLDTLSDLNAPEVLASTSFLKNVWLKISTIVDEPTGTSVTYEYGSTDTLVEPSVWQTSLFGLKQRRYLHVKATLHANAPDNLLTPTVSQNSPYLEYATYWSGEFVPKLLRADGTEFAGGILALGVEFPSRLAEYDIRSPQGRVRRHQRTDKIGKFSGFTLRSLSEDAKVELEETCLDEDFMIEAYNRRYIVRFGEQVILTRVEGMPLVRPLNQGNWAMYEGEVGETEILESAYTGMAGEFL